MPDEARNDPQVDTLDSESQRTIRERVTRLAFGNDPKRYDEFIRVLSEATPEGVEVILRGSAVTGHKFGSDEPFDHDGPGTSDLDVTFVGGDMVMLFNSFYIPGVHSVPLSEEHPFASPALSPWRPRLCERPGSPVTLRAPPSLPKSLRAVKMAQPYLVLLKKP